MSAAERLAAVKAQFAAEERIAEAAGLHPDEVSELYRVADRMRPWDGRGAFALDGSDFFGALRCLPKLLDALAATPLPETEPETCEHGVSLNDGCSDCQWSGPMTTA